MFANDPTYNDLKRQYREASQLKGQARIKKTSKIRKQMQERKIKLLNDQDYNISSIDELEEFFEHPSNFEGWVHNAKTGIFQPDLSKRYISTRAW